MRAVAEQEMTALAALKSYLLFMQICGALSSSVPAESRVIQSYVGCVCVGVCVLLPAQVQHPALTKTGLARSGGLRKEENHQNLSLFFPQALAKIQRHRFAFIRRCGGDHRGFQSQTTKIPFCLFTKSTGCSEKCLCAGLVRGSLNYSRSS